MRNKLIYLSLKIFFVTFSFYCASAQIPYGDAIELLYDNYWLNDDTLQIQVGYSNEENIPYSLRGEKACTKAKELIDARLLSLYPTLKEVHYHKNIYKTLFLEKSECRLVVHISYPNLKNKIK
ncbi:MAG: hypothetical protein OEV66_00495 [Spirochaetia bacterium]|nr:hypothetical protein [Spirochaetia bacterium]